MSRGKLITIYGVNNIGKSTQTRILVRKLKESGCDVIYLKYPVYDLEPTGPKLNKILRSASRQQISEEELQTLFMQNRKDYQPTLQNMLNEGKIVIAEDYTGTGIAWGTAKGLDLTFMEDLNKDLLKEDFSILLTGHRDLRVREKIHIHESDDALMEKVGNILLHLAEKYKWHKVELRPSISDTAEIIWNLVADFLKSSA